VGDKIKVRPGIVTKACPSNSGAAILVCSPIFSQISSLYAERNNFQCAIPGDLITSARASIRHSHAQVNLLGLRRKLPEVFAKIEILYYLLQHLLGIKTSGGGKQAKIQKLTKGEILMVNIGSMGMGGKVKGAKLDLAKISQMQPVCTQEGEMIMLSRWVDKYWRLIRWGEIMKGKRIKILEPFLHEWVEMRFLTNIK
jgi:translation initiation factor 2 subunit 3